jgi:DNA-binding response OmpR family regulator
MAGQYIERHHYGCRGEMLPQPPESDDKFCVLIVEDDVGVARMVETTLIDAGFRCHLATDGRSALQAFKDIQPHLVVLDIMLPGMDGRQVCAKLRQTSMVPILILTALDSEDDQVEAFQLGAGGYVGKPFTAQLLMKRVNALLQRVYHDATATERRAIATNEPGVPQLRLLDP